MHSASVAIHLNVILFFAPAPSPLGKKKKRGSGPSRPLARKKERVRSLAPRVRWEDEVNYGTTTI